jgi:organic hydroperoxide reductase OsmC/OhrA
MSEHRATIEWSCTGLDFRRHQYSREHTWRFDGGTSVPASASPGIVPAPWSNAAAVDPEEAFVASVSSCHMLWWLSLAARQGFDVVRNRDEAVGTLGRDEHGRAWISAITLCPRIDYGTRAATPEEESRLHEQAHAQCFIANSIRTQVVVRPGGEGAAGGGAE